MNHIVQIKDVAYVPDKLSIAADDTVCWENVWAKGSPHTATSDVPVGTSGYWGTEKINPGQVGTPIAFAETGSFHYHCRYHPAMHGTITVVPIYPQGALHG